MPIRMTGMASGLDTDAIIKELMSAQSMKKTKIEQKKTKLEWKQEKWADLNTKLYKLYTEQVSKLRLTGSYAVKKASSANESVLTATATTSAGTGSHRLEVKQLASAQYLTGLKATVTDLKGSSKLTQIVDPTTGKGIKAGQVIRITSGVGENATVKALKVTTTTTVQEFVNALKDAGLNASFEESQGRFFISGKNSGADNAFAIELFEDPTVSGGGLSDLEQAAKNLTDTLAVTNEQVAEYRNLLDSVTKKQKAVGEAKTSSERATAQKALAEAENKRDEMEEKMYSAIASKRVGEARLQAVRGGGVDADYDSLKNAVINDPNYATMTQDEKDAAIAKAEADYVKGYLDTLSGEADFDAEIAALKASPNNEIEAYKQKLDDYNNVISTAIEDNNYTNWTLADADSWAALGLDNISMVGADGNPMIDTIGEPQRDADGNVVIQKNTGVTLTQAADAIIKLDEAELTASSNDISVAGVTYSLKNTTKESGAINVTVTNDTSAVYDMMKDFVKQYNELLKEMNTLYHADSSRGYDPLTDEEKESMSEKQIELWENKIKDSLLRRDDTLNSVISIMRTSLQTSVTVNGKNYSLSDFGIVTGDYTEKGLLHIYGNTEDADYGDYADRLMKMFSENPEDAAEALSGIMKNLYSSLQKKMAGNSISSAMTFYNDKQMKKEITNYGKDIKKWETRLKDMEDRYYKQFTAMETALTKLQSQSNYLMNLMGGGSNN